MLGNRTAPITTVRSQVSGRNHGKGQCPQVQSFLESELFVLLSCRGSTLPADTHSLSCNVIVKTHTTPPQPWCEGQCSVDGESFLQYDNDNKATPLGDLGKAAHASQVWKDFIQGLEFLGQELRKMLADTNLGPTKIQGHPTLQTIMLSQLEQGQIVGASLLFNISGKYSFTLNTMNMSWTPISLEPGGIMNKWTDDEELTKCLKISMANLSYWLKEFLTLHMERTSRYYFDYQKSTPSNLIDCVFTKARERGARQRGSGGEREPLEQGSGAAGQRGSGAAGHLRSRTAGEILKPRSPQRGTERSRQ
ncbi:retinoic acid early-inducible protein 1-epsilon-like [Onychomys torridus]|uniref:retinoic acid early-inducible protein 1-epsilon-like n=1 Tax=Onychomys torridus TaxID=38674 RepID=UPI00167F92C5|nr:retinoic acid early-inducible protein 1-epsilon-like [Onychomys torridus]